MSAQARPPRVMFYVQHLLGIGHQRRGATLTRALGAAGFEVTFVSGGHEIPNLDLAGATLLQLPATRATDLYFKQLVDEEDRPIDDSWRAARRERLLTAWRETRPDILLLELFPFGRRQMRFELTPWLDAAIAARPRPLIVSSVRDILVAQDKPGRNDEMLDRARRYFDHILVHGDRALIAFDETFPHAAAIADKIHYTGYVVDRSGRRGGPGDPGWDEVLVSAGGGAVGLALLHAALDARPLSGLESRTWRVLVGIKVDEDDYRALGARTGPGVIVERARGDFPSLLMNCALSISQGGYNTVMEALIAGCRMLIVPYAGGLETEQTLRANLLSRRGALHIVPEAALAETDGARTLAAAIRDAMAAAPPGDLGIARDGAARTGELLRAWHEART